MVQEWLNRYKSWTGGIKFGPRKIDCNLLGYIWPSEEGCRKSISYRQRLWPPSILLLLKCTIGTRARIGRMQHLQQNKSE